VNGTLRDFFDPLAIVVTIFRHPRRVNAAAAVALALTMGGVALARSSDEPGSSVTVPLPPAMPADLYEQASGAAALDIRSTGDEAKMINASLPFAAVPVTPAQPFILSGDDDQRARALLCHTQAVYYEANGEPEEGQRAVAQVVLNRVRHPAFAKSVCGVVYEGASSGTCQFSFVCNGSLDRRPAPAAWTRAQTIARQALYGYVEPSVGEATHYHADYVAPAWGPLLAKVASIGQHIFYRWPGRWGEAAAFTGRYAGEASDAPALHLAAAAAKIEGVRSADAAPKPRVTYDIAALLKLAPEMAKAPQQDEPAAPETSAAVTADAMPGSK
jgi:hypothetical protein